MAIPLGKYRSTGSDRPDVDDELVEQTRDDDQNGVIHR